jgi:glycosyltransferase involved in cell wall biosynthesis
VRIIIASTSIPHIDGGGRLIVRWAADALREAGHEVEEFYLPFPPSVGSTLPAIVGLRKMPFRDACDRLVTIRWPAHVIQHDNKAIWFIHHYRMAFDLWDTEYRNVPDNAEGRSFRELLRGVDNKAFAEARDVFTNSQIVRNRVREHNGLDVDTLYPPLGGDTSRFFTEEYGDFVFLPSRITTIKRQLLAIEALAHTITPVRLVIAGRSEDPAYLSLLEETARRLDVMDRLDLNVGWMDETEKVRLLARCLAVVVPPRDEDSYGYPSLEASHSCKPIVTLSDSGGVLEFVRDGVEGLVAEPDPRSLARAFDRLYDDRAYAERLGGNSNRRRDEMNIGWDHVVRRLVGDPP